jgi:predicted site-specific integrase-resolvase
MMDNPPTGARFTDARFVDTVSAAKMLGIAPRTVRKWVKDGKITPYREDGAGRYSAVRYWAPELQRIKADRQNPVAVRG